MLDSHTVRLFSVRARTRTPRRNYVPRLVKRKILIRHGMSKLFAGRTGWQPATAVRAVPCSSCRLSGASPTPRKKVDRAHFPCRSQGEFWEFFRFSPRKLRDVPVTRGSSYRLGRMPFRFRLPGAARAGYAVKKKLWNSERFPEKDFRLFRPGLAARAGCVKARYNPTKQCRRSNCCISYDHLTLSNTQI